MTDASAPRRGVRARKQEPRHPRTRRKASEQASLRTPAERVSKSDSLAPRGGATERDFRSPWARGSKAEQLSGAGEKPHVSDSFAQRAKREIYAGRRRKHRKVGWTRPPLGSPVLATQSLSASLEVFGAEPSLRRAGASAKRGPRHPEVSSDARTRPDGSGSEAEQPSAYTEGASLHPARSRNFVFRGLGEGPTSLTKYRSRNRAPASAQGTPPIPPPAPKVSRLRFPCAASAAVAALLASLALLTLAPAAGATYNPVNGGQTKLTLAKPFLALLAANHVKLTAIEGAGLKGGVVTFPVSGGKFDPTTSNGFLEHAGALFFKAGAQKVPLTSLQLKTTQKHAPFSAKFGGGQLKMASAAKLAVSREGFGDKVAVSTLKLSAKVAGRLDKKLRLRGVFKAGQLLGSTVTKADPQTVAVTESGKASFSFDPATAAKLQSLFVAINPVFPAEHPDAGFTLPIFTGTISPTATEGTIQTLGSIELVQIGGGQVFLREAWAELSAAAYSVELELAPSPPYAGKVGRTPVGALSLAGAAVTSDPAARTIGVTNAAVTMGANLAAAFNDAFAKPIGKADVFAAGEPLGTISFTAQAQ